MAGASDISTILSQAGRIEKLNQSPFTQSEVAKQILTEEEARERLRRSREVNASKKAQEIAVKERRDRKGSMQRKKKENDTNQGETRQDALQEEKHIIDVVV